MVIARRIPKTEPKKCSFTRIYVNPTSSSLPTGREVETLLNFIGGRNRKRSISDKFNIEKGHLKYASSDNSSWTLTNAKSEKWLKKIHRSQIYTFGDLAEIKVGIKTTADSVFIRDNWKVLKQGQPEANLLRPLITHHDAARFATGTPKKKVLYPYDLRSSKRVVLDINQFPKTKRYFRSHQSQLEQRKYVVEAGRKWYEIWVPHQPG